MVAQVRKQKSFLQGVFREKEEMVSTCHTLQQKIARLEADRLVCHFLCLYTLETVCNVAICLRGYLLYKQISFINDQ